MSESNGFKPCLKSDQPARTKRANLLFKHSYIQLTKALNYSKESNSSGSVFSNQNVVKVEAFNAFCLSIRGSFYRLQINARYG